MHKTLPVFTAMLACLVLLSAGCATQPTTVDSTFLTVAGEDDGFKPVFNGKDLEGWTPKIRYEDAGEDKDNTFRVKDGMIQVRYDKYGGKFGNRFGHLYLDTPYSHYILRLEYRFVGEQLPDGPGWAFMNSGVMFHGQDPNDMTRDQDFPNSIEVQLLGQSEDNPRERSTGNICTPGTHHVRDGKLIRAHCQNSSSKTFRGDQWVKLELEVHGDGKIIHRINGEDVYVYEQPQLDDGTKLSKGTISLQSESHPCDFRNIEIKVLKE